MLLSVAAAFAAACLGSIPGTLLLVFSLVNAPLFAVILLGMFWQRATGHGAFSGLIAGAVAALLHHGLTLPIAARPGIHGGWIAVLHRYPGNLAQCFWTAAFAFAVSFLVAIAVSYCTKARSRKELAGLVRSLKPKPRPAKITWWKRPETLAFVILLAAVAVNIVFA
jgi:SSS family solute:Na+ symporter